MKSDLDCQLIFLLMWLVSSSHCETSVYPAKGRPGSGRTKLDSGTQKRLRRSRIEVYGPHPQARARLARVEVGQRAGMRADCRPLRSPALVARADFL